MFAQKNGADRKEGKRSNMAVKISPNIYIKANDQKWNGRSEWRTEPNECWSIRAGKQRKLRISCSHCSGNYPGKLSGEPVARLLNSGQEQGINNQLMRAVKVQLIAWDYNPVFPSETKRESGADTGAGFIIFPDQVVSRKFFYQKKSFKEGSSFLHTTQPCLDLNLEMMRTDHPPPPFHLDRRRGHIGQFKHQT